jgi:retron-type reverse transcriptase
VSHGPYTISAVYCPPTTLDARALISLLNELQSSTVILGDINTRFRDPIYQAGEPGPPQRLQVITDFLTQTNFRHVKPVHSREKLTTDHCFVQAGQRAQLGLLSNTSQKIKTDHQHTLSLTLGQEEEEEEQAAQKPTRASNIKRFRVSRLSHLNQREALRALISQLNKPFSVTERIDEINTKLVQFCQSVQEQTIGLATPLPTYQKKKKKKTTTTTHEQTLAASIRLYKHASQISQENEVIFPTPEARAKGWDAVTENRAILQERWTGQPFQAQPGRASRTQDTARIVWTREQVVEEIQKQDAEKSCGADGTHIRFLKAVQDTVIITWLQQLYNQCLAQGTTPRAWNESEIYLLTKNVGQRRDAKNLRPISIIGIFRKIFERLLLLQVQDQPWAKLHPAQAGFRRGYSTYSNVAVVHILLASKARSTVLFLDFKSAFDVVDHDRLDAKLAQKGCPETIRSLIQNLMFCHLKSRILINGQVTDWFSRSRGVLQGSPLSPWLFNLFIDDLLYKVNTDAPAIPWCLFYADDGVIITPAQINLASLLQIVEDWTQENAIFLNPAKCAVITSCADLPPLQVYGQEIPRVESYTYLGFPVTREGIDFPTHLRERIQAAIGRAVFLGIQSNAWGPAHRLRVYKQFLAPMFEYGAPLVWAWAQQNREEFDQVVAGFKDLIAWIANTSDRRWRMTANLCGLALLPTRFRHLSTAYQLILKQMNPESPL